MRILFLTRSFNSLTQRLYRCKYRLQGARRIVQADLHTGQIQPGEGELALRGNQEIDALLARRRDIRRRTITIARRDQQDARFSDRSPRRHSRRCRIRRRPLWGPCRHCGKRMTG